MNKYEFKKQEGFCLLNYFNAHMPSSDKISQKTFLKDQTCIKAYLKTVPTGSNKEIFERIYHLEFLGSFYKIIQFNLVHPASIAPVERSFYFMSLIESE